LVAEDDRPHVPRVDRQGVRRSRLPRLQPHVLPAVHPRLSRHAAALPRVSRGVPGAERAVDGRRVHPRRRLPPSASLLLLVAAPRRDRDGQSVGGNGPRVADDVAAAHRELRAYARRHARALRLSAARDAAPGPREGGRRWLTPPPRPCTSTSLTTSTTPTSSAMPRPSACGCSS